MRFGRHRFARGFSLLEVVAAIGLFAIGIVTLLGLYVPLAQSVGRGMDAEAAARIATPLRVELSGRVASARSFDPVVLLLKTTVADGTHQLEFEDAMDPRLDPKILFASHDGSKLGSYADPVWDGADAEKFFAIALVRNETVSPTANDATAATLAYTARIRWPAFVADSSASNPRRAIPHGGAMQMLFVAGTVNR